MRNERGITLVALVVTIVVLLILAGVTITYALSNNGIFERAKEARDKCIKVITSDEAKVKRKQTMLEKYGNE